MLIIALGAHMLAAIVWVGGMFFAHLILRPAMTSMPDAERLALRGRLLPRFFAWVWAAIIVLFITGYGVLYFGYEGLAGAGLHIRLMEGIGLIMMLLFGWMYFRPFKSFMRAFKEGDSSQAAAEFDRIRGVVLVNLVLGVIVSVLGATGNFWG
ncbi:MAG: CopD family protein [Alphaproteobacteria bacterium]|jgi:uncharacterized membrane protein|nr:CopD family protein [Alphaproteobacteria bacterium]